MCSHTPLGRAWRSDLTALSTGIAHRGPDDHGFYTDAMGSDAPVHELASASEPPLVAFAHRRLSILDLSEAARQPMVRRETFITYNGEVYNYRELRAELEAAGAVFRTQSDTEVVLAAYEHWGIRAVKRLRGIFAFALADLAARKVYLVRDHLGVKPLYLARDGARWLFASEAKAFTGIDGFERSVDPSAIAQYLRFLWIPGTRTGLAGIEKVPAASWIEIDLATGASSTHRYWTPLDAHMLEPIQRSSDDLSAELEHELRRVVAEQLVSDVPLGAFLSGGLDSSIVVALMRAAGVQRPTTFSVGYSPDDLAYDIVPDDLPFAREVSDIFATRNTEIVLSPDVASLLPALVETLDEPLGDPAALSSYLICHAAKQSSSVMLSGVGADELFGGYPRQRALVYGNALRRMPAAVRAGARSLAMRLPGAGRSGLAKLGRAGQKFTAALEREPLEHYVAMETYFSPELQAEVLMRDGEIPVDDGTDVEPLLREIHAVTDDPLKQSVLWDLLTYLPNLNLAYTDRTSMAHAVEVRVPFLDVKLVEWSLALRARQLIDWHRGRLTGKWLLKHTAERLLPRNIVWRKKAGFGAPVRSWLRGELSELREELLGPRGLAQRGWFAPAAIRRLTDDFTAGRRDYALQLWMLMSLELWARRFLDRR